MLDPVAEADRLPDGAGRCECVECGSIRSIADRVHRDRPACGGACADDLGQLVAGRDPHAGAVEHPCRLRSESPVHEALEVAETEEVVADARAETELGEGGHAIGRQRLEDPQPQPFALVDATEDRRGAEPAVLVVDRSHPASVRQPDSRTGRLDPLLLRDVDETFAEAPRRFLTEDPGRLAGLVPLNDPAGDLQLTSSECESGRVEPERVVILRPERGGRRARHLVERFPCRGRLPTGVPPARAANPRPGHGVPADPVERLAETRGAVEPNVGLRQRPGREVDVRIGEGREDAAAAQVDVVGSRKRRLVRPDATRDERPCERERGHRRQRPVHRSDHAVRQKHRAPLAGRGVDVENAALAVVICVPLRQDHVAIGDDRAVPVAGSGRQRREHAA